MFNQWEDSKLFSRWSIRKITFIGILIAISVVFLVILATLVPIASIPSYKISVIGLPVKITGFIFGPIVGGIVGLISDLLAFLFVPNIYNPLYTLATMVDGIIAGIIGWLFLKVFKYYFGGRFRDSVYELKIVKLEKKMIEAKINNWSEEKIAKLENKIIYFNENRKKIRVLGTKNILLNFYAVISTLILMTIIFFVIWLIGWKTSQATIDKGIIKSKIGLLTLMVSGYSVMIVFIWIARFKMKNKHFLVIVPIVIFSALIELINIPLLSFADATSLSNDGQSIFVYVFQHTLFSPIKIWFNMFVIFFTYNIINPLVNKNNGIMY